MGRKQFEISNNVTIHQVAEKAGVSIATVSRVLNDSDNVSEDLKTRVNRVVQEIGYRPNRAAKNLREGKVRKVGVLFADIRNPFFTSVLAGIESELQEAEYVLVLGNSNEDPRIEKTHLDTFLEEGVAGILFSASTNSSANYKFVQQKGIPMLAFDRFPVGIRVDSVTINNVAASRQATVHLLDLGYKKIGLVAGPETVSTAQDRQQGYLEALKSAGIEQAYIETGDFRQEGGYQAMKRLLAKPDRPAAVLVANNLMTLGALQAIHEEHLQIPKEIALVGFDDMPWATSLQPPLTVVAQPTYEMGKIAARLLLDRIKNPSDPVHQVILDTQLIIRESCGGLMKKKSK